MITIHIKNAQFRNNNTRAQGDTQSAKQNHSQLAGTVPETELDTVPDGTGRKDTDTIYDTTVRDTLLGELGNDNNYTLRNNENNDNS